MSVFVSIAAILACGVTVLAAEQKATKVTYGPAAKVKFQVELITDTAGKKAAGGVGRSCWGFNQTNIVRHRDNVYAMCWRDDRHLIVFRRAEAGKWEASPPLPRVPQNGVLMVDSKGRAHVIAGDRASYHVVFDPPGQVREFSVQRFAKADTRFGASIRTNDDILVAGGLPAMTWYALAANNGYRPAATGRVPHRLARAYYFVAFDGSAGHAFCGDDYFVKGTGYHTLKTYYYHNPNVFNSPDDWKMTIVSDVSDTLQGKTRGRTEQEDLLIDRKDRVHLLCMQNRKPVTGVWGGHSDGQDPAEDQLYHVVGKPGGPLKHYLLGNFSRGRLYQTPDGRIHYLLTRGRWFNFNLHHALSEEDHPQVVSQPIQLQTPSKLDHVFVNSRRAGGTLAASIDCWFTGPYPGKNNKVWYGRVTPLD